MAADTSNTGTTGLEIAVVGMAGRFPGARDLEAFWRNLRDGVESITFLKDSDLEASALDSPGIRSDPNYVKAAAFLEDADLFDASYFGVTPKEAEVMDPQQRVFLECAVEALENAGYDAERFRGRVGVYAGARTDTYVFNLFSNQAAVGGLDPFEIGLGNDLAFLTTRVAHRLNLRGPAYSVHTACSTSLVALHLASQALLADECQLAIAGGVAINVPQKVGYLYQYGSIMSPDGHCRAFDAKAAGTIFGSGVGLVVLKRLEDALADGDTIHAVIKGSAINNDGSVKASFTAPSVQGQATVIKDALAAADVPADSINYVEAHGTGTALGDPIEIRALTKAFGSKTRGKRSVAIGSVKTNVGHLDAAAGSASLLKAILALKHQQMPPSLHFESPNPQIDFDSGPFYVNTSLQPWAKGRTPRRAGVSSFGIGGTNAHIVLEEAPPAPPSAPGRPWELLVLSARSHTALDTATARLAQHLEDHPEAALADVAYTLQVGRKAHAHRRLVVVKDSGDAARVLRMAEPQRVLTGAHETGNRPVAFLFSDAGVGAHLEPLYRSEPAFRAEVDRCAELLQKHLGLDLRTALYPDDGGRPALTGPVAAAAHFVEPYALARLWMAWGVQPESLLGEGMGELVAACLAGVLPLEDALTLAVARAGGAEPVLNGHTLKAPEVPLYSAATGALLTAAEATRAATWLEAAGRPSRVTDGLRELVKEATRVLLVVGSPGVLLEAARALAGSTGTRTVLASLPAPGDTTPVPAAVLTMLGRLWLEGVEVDWEGLYEGQARRRVPLPTYPFERQRFWVAPAERSATAQAQGPQGKLVDMAEWFHVPSWRRTAPAALDRKALAERRCWVVFVDGLGVGEALCRRLEEANQEVVRVRPGTAFMRDAERRYALDPRQPGDYATLWKDLADQELQASTVVHLWSLTPQGEGVSSPELFRKAQDTGYYSLLHLGQALAKGDTSRQVRVEVVTNRVHDLEGEHHALPEKATVLGPCKVIPQEQEHVSTRCIDIIAPEPLSDGVAEVASRLLAELSQKPKDVVVAWRGNHRFAQHFAPMRLDAEGEPPHPLREKGVYLITGGLGAVGLLLANYLAETVHARLALLGRSEMPAPAEWDAYLASHSADDKVSRQIASVRELEKRGAEVMVVRADVADAAQLEAAVAQVEARFGALHGVLHCAGVTQGPSLYNPLTDIGRGESETQFGPKVYGTYALEKALRSRAVDFVVLFSSNAAVLGGLGYLTYASSNLFMDAFAQARSGRPGTRWVSASWDPWPEETKHNNVRTSMDQYAMTTQEGAEAVRRLATLGVDGQVVVATGDLQQRWKLWIQRDTSQQSTGGRVASKARRSKTPYVAPETELEKQLAALWQEVLGVEGVGLHDNFFDLGGHSLLATRVAGRLRTQFDFDVPLAKLFEAATVSALAKLVADHQAALEEAASQAALDELANLSDEEIEAELARRSS
ncbi:type I polyketide synthase [Pyxidicoccus xibeiensis]|uniref:type I polyketide synthase n=1 Tax=Pyxidicoccus xibeiensis TaxID=2906759 RepID=UPI0020A6EDAD|nr:type I polyketide synthase [Pyxidicoccus xibeiensis]MCP3140919.1 SDR family oxidoreductase [Pyxidicoccus xibeiensis]